MLYGENAAYTDGVQIRQARQDLNPQPLVLETSALPIEPLAYFSQIVVQAMGCDSP